MTTKTSPGQTENETSRTAATQPVFALQLAAREVGVRRADDRSACGPKIFQTPSARISGSPAAIDAVPVRLC